MMATPEKSDEDRRRERAPHGATAFVLMNFRL
jgi:hypothetical protein